MYQNFFGFKNKPFSLNPTPDFLFLGKSHQTIVSGLEYGLINGLGIMVVTGEIGTGKSTHIHYLLNKLEPIYTASLITNTNFCSLAEMLSNILLVFGLPRQKESKENELELVFKKFLGSQFRRNKKVLLIIDEAQNLSLQLLENLRLLSNFSIDEQQVLQLILVGQPSLAEKINNPGLEQLSQRVSLFEELMPLDRKETHQYILHQLEVAGLAGSRKIMGVETCNEIYKFSAGIPKLINLICELALFRAFENKVSIIDAGLVLEVVKERQGGVLQFEQVTASYGQQEEKDLEQLHVDVSVESVNVVVDSSQSEELLNDAEHSKINQEFAKLSESAISSLSKQKDDYKSKVDEPEIAGKIASSDFFYSKTDAINTDEIAVEQDDIQFSRSKVFNIKRQRLAWLGISIFFGICLSIFITDNDGKSEQLLSQLLFYDKINLKTNDENTSEQNGIMSIEVNNKHFSQLKLNVEETEADERKGREPEGVLDHAHQQENSLETRILEAVSNKANSGQLLLKQSNIEMWVSEPSESNIEVEKNLHNELLKISEVKENQVDILISNKKAVTEKGRVPVSDQAKSILLSGQSLTGQIQKPELEQKTNSGNSNLVEQSLIKESKNEEQVKALLKNAESLMSNLQLTIPAEQSAWKIYKQILEVDSQQKQALDGIKKIKVIYKYWAEREIDRKNFERAEYFFNKALIVAPTDTTLLASLSKVQNTRSTLSDPTDGAETRLLLE